MRNFEDLTPDETLTLYAAAIMGEAEFELAMGKLDKLRPEEDRPSIKVMREEYLKACDAVRAGKDPFAPTRERITERLMYELMSLGRTLTVEEVADAMTDILDADAVTGGGPRRRREQLMDDARDILAVFLEQNLGEEDDDGRG